MRNSPSGKLQCYLHILLCPDHCHTCLHESRTGRVERRGYRYSLRYLLAWSPALRAIDRDHTIQYQKKGNRIMIVIFGHSLTYLCPALHSVRPRTVNRQLLVQFIGSKIRRYPDVFVINVRNCHSGVHSCGSGRKTKVGRNSNWEGWIR